MKISALYIHIPFCDHKCIYCDFYSIITTDNIPSFLNSLKKEADYFSNLYKNNRIFSSIFFGGGTPSLMEPEYLKEILDHLKSRFIISDDVEITMETNPGTVDKNKLKKFYDFGINRISIGIQSFHEDELKFLTRIHDKQTAIDTVYNAREAGFENINIDLIFNLPGQTNEKWISNLETAFELPITHLSAYSLILERGTILNKMVLDGKVEMQGEDYDADLYETTIDFAELKKFKQYEVSNFCLPGFECRHNNAYWRYRDYLSIGPSAHSFMNGKRWWNFSSLKKYIHEIETNHHAKASSEFIGIEESLDEYIMLALRSSGIDKKELHVKFGDLWINKNYHYIQLLARENLLIQNENYISLTKKGYAVCDEILSRFI